MSSNDIFLMFLDAMPSKQLGNDPNEVLSVAIVFSSDSDVIEKKN